MNPATKKKAAPRHKQEIIYDILKTARTPKTKTGLQYQVMISWEQIDEFVKDLVDHGLLCYNPFDGTYIITQNGMRYIQG